MTSLIFEPMNLDGLVYFILAIMFGPAILLTFIGVMIRKKNKKAAKIFFILAVVYMLISLGICGSLLLIN